MDTNAYEKLGNYCLVRRLGAGGFSEVYLGEHLYLKTPAAIKVLHSRLFDQESLNDFLTEARIIAQLDHPHIVRVLEFGVEGSIPYLVLQYAPNGTVRQRYPKGSRVPPLIIVQYVKQIAEALHYAHELKIIHRDIKPENFLLGKDGEILLSDFGLAMPSQSSIGISDHERAGTAVYMAPEQSQGRSSRASDQYALGVVVYEWLCGHPPFKGTEYEVLHQHINALPPLLREIVPMIPETIEQVVMRALAKEPSERFSQIQDFALALEAAYQSQAPVVDQSSLSEAKRDDAGNVQQAEHSSFSTVLSPPSIVFKDQKSQAAADLAIQNGESAATPPTKWERRMSRRTAIAAGMLGLVALGGAAALYLVDAQSLGLTHIFSRATAGSTARTRSNGTAHTGGGTGNTPGAGPNGAGTSSSPGKPANTPSGQSRGGTNTPSATATSGNQVGGSNTTTTLTVQIDNSSALAQVNVNSQTNVDVTTSQVNIPATVQVTYSNGAGVTLGPQTTDGNGNTTFTWHVHPGGGLGHLTSLSAILVASATGTNGQTASSVPGTVNILLNGNGNG